MKTVAKPKSKAVTRTSAAKGRELVTRLAPAKHPVHEFRNVLEEPALVEPKSKSAKRAETAKCWSETRRIQTHLSRVVHCATWHALKQQAALKAAKANNGNGELK